ncbi:MAG: aldo/keto reductase [Dehalococcoidales bacterium]|nr:aldo/keto reductase [Dehalococcoidales bacterium]
MDKIRLGRTNLMVTRLGFGGIPIQRDTEEEAIAVVKRCLEHGINYLDTANGYTNSEERIGKAIQGRPRKDIVLATKTQARDREGVEKHLKLSLKHMQVDYIDVYQFHNISDKKGMDAILAPGGPLDTARDAQKAGLIRHIGITSHNWDVAKQLVATDHFSTIMVPFNFVTREPADDLLPLARKHDVGFIAMKPLNGGALDNINIAFKFFLQFPDVITIPGIEKPHEIDEIIKVINGPAELTRAEREEMERIRSTMGNRFCRRCDYCQPCNAGIPISVVMSSFTFERRLPPESLLTGWFHDAITKAKDCIECGECETRCPYHLPIRDMIQEQLQWYREFCKKYSHLAKQS